MKLKPIVAFWAAAAIGSVAAADFTDTAQVISSSPIYEKVTDPKQECWTETANAPAQPSQERGMAAPILGGVAGAILGSQVGQGRGRDAAAATGAVVGTVAGDRVANPNSPGSTTGAVVGGIAGAILGTQVGSGSGRTAATAAGAVAGTMIGDRVGSPGASAPQPASVQRCRTVETTRDVLKGYRVVYRYGGRDIETTLPYDPGNAVRVAVSAIDAAQTSGAPQPAVQPTAPASAPTQSAPRYPDTRPNAGGGHRH